PDAPKGSAIALARLVLFRTLQREPLDWTDTEAALKQAEQLDPQNPEVTLLWAELFATRNDNDRAEQTLTQARDRDPQQVLYWTGLAALAEHRQAPEKAWQLLQEAERQAGDSVPLRLARARYWANRGGAETAAELAKLRTGLDQFPRDEQARLLRGLAETYTRLGDRATAAKLWEELAAQPRYKADLRLRLVLFNLALQARDQDAMKRHLAEIRTLEGDDGTFYRYGEACRLI